LCANYCQGYRGKPSEKYFLTANRQANTDRDKMIEKLKLPVGSPTEEFFLDRIFLKVDSQEN
jgi:hypothetical protein